MGTPATLVFVAAAALICPACSNGEVRGALDICEAIRRGPELIGKPISIVGAYDYAGYWSAIGSAECPKKLIEPRFQEKLTMRFERPSPERDRALRDELARGFLSPTEFQGQFHGVLRKRPDVASSGLHSPPDSDHMPYLFDVERIDHIRVGPSLIGDPPPPLPPDWR